MRLSTIFVVYLCGLILFTVNSWDKRDYFHMYRQVCAIQGLIVMISMAIILALKLDKSNPID